MKKRKDGLYQVRRTIDGVERSFYGRTIREATEAAEQAKREAAQQSIRAASPTVADYLTRWIAAKQSPPYAYNTLRKYRSAIAVHLAPRFKHILLADLGPRDIERMTNDLLAGGMQPKSVNAIRQTLSVALNDAVRDELASRNPVALTKAPRQERQEVEPLTLAEAHTFLQAVRGDRLEALYTAVLACGIRQAEALGLRWEDIDLATGYVRLDVQLVREKGRWDLPRLKTPASRRRFYLPAPALAALIAHKERETIHHPWGLIFTTAKGEPIHGTSLRLWFHALCERAGLPYQKFHDMRHCCVSLLIAQGVPARHIADLLGHTSTRITEDVYGHIFRDSRRDVADTMGRLLTRADGESGA